MLWSVFKNIYFSWMMMTREIELCLCKLFYWYVTFSTQKVVADSTSAINFTEKTAFLAGYMEQWSDPPQPYLASFRVAQPAIIKSDLTSKKRKLIQSCDEGLTYLLFLALPLCACNLGYCFSRRLQLRQEQKSFPWVLKWGEMIR